MYKTPKFHKTKLDINESVEGETIENKFERILNNNESIKDGAPEIFTDRRDGVVAGYNIRTDRFEVAIEGTDFLQKSIQAKREEKAKTFEDKSKVIDLKSSEGTSTQGTSET